MVAMFPGMVEFIRFNQRAGRLHVALGVLSLVQDTDNVQAVGVVQEIDHMRATKVLLEPSESP
jgi:hypothetical protein